MTKILFIEEDDMLRDMVVGFLQAHGYCVQGTTSLNAAAAAIKRQVYTVLIADLRLLNSSNLAALMMLKRMRPALRCALISANVEVLSYWQRKAKTVEATLIKPFALEDLHRLVQKLCSYSSPVTLTDCIRQYWQLWKKACRHWRLQEYYRQRQLYYRVFALAVQHNLLNEASALRQWSKVEELERQAEVYVAGAETSKKVANYLSDGIKFRSDLFWHLPGSQISSLSAAWRLQRKMLKKQCGQISTWPLRLSKSSALSHRQFSKLYDMLRRGAVNAESLPQLAAGRWQTEKNVALQPAWLVNSHE